MRIETNFLFSKHTKTTPQKGQSQKQQRPQKFPRRIKMIPPRKNNQRDQKNA